MKSGDYIYCPEDGTIKIANPLSIEFAPYAFDIEEVDDLIRLINSLDESEITDIERGKYDSKTVIGLVDFEIEYGDILEMISIRSLPDNVCTFDIVLHYSSTNTQEVKYSFEFTSEEAVNRIAEIQKYYQPDFWNAYQDQ